MSGPDAAGAGQYRVPAGLLEKLMAAVRPEFRAGELAFDPQRPGVRREAVPGPRLRAPSRRPAGSARDTGSGGPPRDGLTCGIRHVDRSRGGGGTPRWTAARHRDAVTASGSRKGLCARHASAWDTAGTPSLPEWLARWRARSPPVAPGGLPDRQLRAVGRTRKHWCRSHGATWKRRGRPRPAEFAAGWAAEDPGPARERIRLDGLPAQLKLEVQYALQRRHDDREGKAPPYVVMLTVRVLAASGASSLLDRTEQEWRDEFGKRGNAVALLAWFRRQVADLAEGSGWDAEYPRDAWQMHRLGFEGRVVLDFSGIPQPELKDLAKRWIRWRLSTGLAWMRRHRPLRVLTRFAAFLHARGITGAGGISRAVLEDYLADLQAAMAGRPEHGAHVSIIGLFLTAVRQHGWDPDLPADAMIFPGDQPPRIELLPRALAGHVMAQVEQPGNLDRQGTPPTGWSRSS